MPPYTNNKKPKKVKKKIDLSFLLFLEEKKDDLGARSLISNTKSKKIKFDGNFVIMSQCFLTYSPHDSFFPKLLKKNDLLFHLRFVARTLAIHEVMN